MCGICGIVEFGRGGECFLRPLCAMVATLAHRGPDQSGTWACEHAGLGHARLAIIDPSDDGWQPMATADGALVVAFNGEIYNFQELRQELSRGGAIFRTRTDTEVILEVYRRHGIEGVSRLDGMFAFALWDAKAQELYLVRDRVRHQAALLRAPGRAAGVRQRDQGDIGKRRPAQAAGRAGVFGLSDVRLRPRAAYDVRGDLQASARPLAARQPAGRDDAAVLGFAENR